MKFRKAISTDAKTLAKNNVMMAKESENVDIDFNTTLAGISSVLEDSSKGFYVVAEDKGEIIGQLMITFEWSDWRNKAIWWIQSVYIVGPWRRKGVFSGLLQEIYTLGEKEGVSCFRLYVHGLNRGAIEVYRKLGLVEGKYVMFECCND